MKKIVSLAAVCCAVFMLFAACSSGDSSPDGGADVTYTASTLPETVSVSGTNPFKGLVLTDRWESYVYTFTDNLVIIEDTEDNIDSMTRKCSYTYNEKNARLYVALKSVVIDGKEYSTSEYIEKAFKISEEEGYYVKKYVAAYEVLDYAIDDETVTLKPVFDGTIESTGYFFGGISFYGTFEGRISIYISDGYMEISNTNYEHSIYADFSENTFSGVVFDMERNYESEDYKKYKKLGTATGSYRTTTGEDPTFTLKFESAPELLSDIVGKEYTLTWSGAISDRNRYTIKK